jgi:hypothetical protein
LAHRGRTITLPSEVLGGDKSIFVKHLDRNIDNQALYDTFSLLGNIASCKVAGDLAGKSRGYGFVHYETKEAATQAIERVNGMRVGEQIVEVQPFKGAMVRKTASSGCNFVHYETEEAAKQAIARADGDGAGFTTVRRDGTPKVFFGACLAAARPAAALSQRARRQCGRVGGGPSKEEQHLACLAATRAALAAKCAAVEAALGSLQRDQPGDLVGVVARDGGVLEAVVDSGAEESVAPPGFFAAEMVPSPMSKAGGKYRAANGTRIRNLGQQKVAFTTAEGHKCTMPFQVAEDRQRQDGQDD